MPVFEYVALNSSGKNTKGSIDAENIRAARQKLRAQGMFPTDIKEAREAVKQKSKDIQKLFSSDRVGLKDVAIATRQLATLAGAGLPLVSALAALTDQTESSALKRIVVDVREHVEEGETLARSLANYPKTFPRLYINMVASGEASGTLDKVLENLADYYESQIELRRKVTSALVYPILMLGICFCVVTGLLMFVVPKIVEIFDKQGAVLPLPTRITQGMSQFLVNNWFIVLPILALLPMCVRFYYSRPTGRSQVDRILMKIPIFGGIYIKVATARVARTLGTLLSSGVNLLDGLEIVKNIISNVHIAKALEEAKDGVREGRSLAKELSKANIFPVMLGHMIAIGEKSGELEQMLGRAGKAYETEVNATLSGLTSLLEPVMIIAVGMIVLFIVISILLPITDLVSLMQH